MRQLLCKGFNWFLKRAKYKERPIDTSFISMAEHVLTIRLSIPLAFGACDLLAQVWCNVTASQEVVRISRFDGPSTIHFEIAQGSKLSAIALDLVFSVRNLHYGSWPYKATVMRRQTGYMGYHLKLNFRDHIKIFINHAPTTSTIPQPYFSPPGSIESQRPSTYAYIPWLHGCRYVLKRQQK